MGASGQPDGRAGRAVQPGPCRPARCDHAAQPVTDDAADYARAAPQQPESPDPVAVGNQPHAEPFAIGAGDLAAAGQHQ